MVPDLRQGVYINGNLIAGTNDGGAAWAADQALLVAAGSGFFNPGLNVLELRGSSINSGWDGFWLDVTLEGRDRDGDVPEPASITLLAGALIGVAARRYRRA